MECVLLIVEIEIPIKSCSAWYTLNKLQVDDRYFLFIKESSLWPGISPIREVLDTVCFLSHSHIWCNMCVCLNFHWRPVNPPPVNPPVSVLQPNVLLDLNPSFFFKNMYINSANSITPPLFCRARRCVGRLTRFHCCKRIHNFHNLFARFSSASQKHEFKKYSTTQITYSNELNHIKIFSTVVRREELTLTIQCWRNACSEFFPCVLVVQFSKVFKFSIRNVSCIHSQIHFYHERVNVKFDQLHSK